MNRFAWAVGVMALVASTQSNVVNAQSSVLVAKNVNQSWFVQKGSPDFNHIRAFLMSQSGSINYYHASSLAVDKLGDFTVQVSKHGTGQVMPDYDENDPPDTPPDGGNPSIGDTWSVSTCSNGLNQSWTWTYGTGGWVETDYSKHQGTSCSPNKNRLPPGTN